jgi:2-polyprenyl-3-methyl-5-hydroxy-6-metoxy-1,4-benzoquinol methylase
MKLLLRRTLVLSVHYSAMNFSNRSYEKELLDRDDIPFADIKRNMEELDYINRKLGGHKITISGLTSVMSRAGANGNILTVLEIGCGGGDNLRVIKNYFQSKNIAAKLSGVDINRHCIEFARSRKENEGIEFIHSDYKLYQPANKPDIIFNSLFCHHFADNEVVEVFKWMRENSGAGFFVNDLHRHPLAYYSIKLLTKFFSKSYLVKNDAPLSVLRGFNRKELEMFTAQSSIYNAQLKWKWAFRWLMTCTHE